MSLSGTDEIRDFPTNYNVDTAEVILRVDGATQVAPDWAAMMNAGNIDLTNSPNAAFSFSWTFSAPDGSLSADSCVGGTDGTAGASGRYGKLNEKHASALSDGVSQCSSALQTICLSFTPAIVLSAPISITDW